MASDYLTIREKAYRSLIEPMPIVDAARELGIQARKVRQLIREGLLASNPDGTITGVALSDFLRRARSIPRKQRA
jgi:hypothetical protein